MIQMTMPGTIAAIMKGITGNPPDVCCGRTKQSRAKTAMAPAILNSMPCFRSFGGFTAAGDGCAGGIGGGPDGADEAGGASGAFGAASIGAGLGAPGTPDGPREPRFHGAHKLAASDAPVTMPITVHPSALKNPAKTMPKIAEVIRWPTENRSSRCGARRSSQCSSSRPMKLASIVSNVWA